MTVPLPSLRSLAAAGLVASFLGVAACDRGGPSTPTAPTAPATPTAPSGPELFVPTLPLSEIATLGVYERVEPPSEWGHSRLTFDADGSFRLEHLVEPGGAVSAAASGLYSTKGDWYVLEFLGSEWVAMASFNGACVAIEYDPRNPSSGEENGRYCRR